MSMDAAAIPGGNAESRSSVRTSNARLSAPKLLQAGGAFAGASFLGGTYFGLIGAVVGSVLGFAVILLANGRSTRHAR
jgi:hypothetical protein